MARSKPKKKKARVFDAGGIVLLVITGLLMVLVVILVRLIYIGYIQTQTDINHTETQLTKNIEVLPEGDNRNFGVSSVTQQEGQTQTDQTDYLDGTTFAGDSNTVRLGSYELVDPSMCFAKDSICISSLTNLPMVEYGSYTLTILEAIDFYKPERVVLTFGTNDIGGYMSNNLLSNTKKL